MPNVGEANSTVRPKFRLEYLTYALPSLYPPSSSGGNGSDLAGEEDIEPEPGSGSRDDVKAQTSRSLEAGWRGRVRSAQPDGGESKTNGAFWQLNNK